MTNIVPEAYVGITLLKLSIYRQTKFVYYNIWFNYGSTSTQYHIKLYRVL